MAREIRRKGENPIFAPTPPLESLRAILSLTATQEFWPEEVWNASETSDQRLQVSMIDISRAYFNAKVDESDPVYVELPPEIDAPPGSCALLRRHMYGTRRGCATTYIPSRLIRMRFVARLRGAGAVTVLRCAAIRWSGLCQAWAPWPDLQLVRF